MYWFCLQKIELPPPKIQELLQKTPRKNTNRQIAAYYN